MHTIEMKKIGDKTYPYLHGKELKNNDKLEVKFDDGHCHAGKILIHEFCCDGKLQPFLPIQFHGSEPWVYLVGMKAKRV